jgi:hypothetical protein
MRIIRTPRLILLAAPAALLICSAAASAQVAALNPATIVIKPVPAGIVTFNAQLMAAVSPTVSGWVQGEARALLARRLAPRDMLASARSDVLGRFSGQSIVAADVETMVQLVMAEITNDARADLEMMLADMKATAAARSAMRSAATSAKAKADSLGGLTVDEMARLQAAIDQKSQLEQMISNIMKAGADAASATLRSLK